MANLLKVKILLILVIFAPWVTPQTLQSLQEEIIQMRGEMNRLSQKLNRFNAVAFNAALSTGSRRIREGERVKFEAVKLNEGNGYNSTTGVFTVPPDGAGLYFFYVHLQVNGGEKGIFVLEKNGDTLCKIEGDNDSNGGGDYPTGTCAATVKLSEGDHVYVEYDRGTNDSPLYGFASFCRFTGFLLKPTE